MYYDKSMGPRGVSVGAVMECESKRAFELLHLVWLGGSENNGIGEIHIQNVVALLCCEKRKPVWLPSSVCASVSVYEKSYLNIPIQLDVICKLYCIGAAGWQKCAVVCSESGVCMAVCKEE